MQNTQAYIHHNPRETERAKLLHFGSACVVAVSVSTCRVVRGYERKRLKMNIDVPMRTIFLIIVWTEVIVKPKFECLFLELFGRYCVALPKHVKCSPEPSSSEDCVPERPNVADLKVKLPLTAAAEVNIHLSSSRRKSLLKSPHISLLLCQVEPPFCSDHTSVIFPNGL